MSAVTARVLAGIALSNAALLAQASHMVADATANAFGNPSPLLGAADRRAFQVGNSVFKANWVEAGASASGLDGLGPLFNARSCSSCHLRDGRSRPPEPQDRERHGLLLRIGVQAEDGAEAPHPAYGGQVQDDAQSGAKAEARVEIRYESKKGAYGDGSEFELLAPSYELSQLAYGELGDRVVLGPRVAQHLVGLGLLESIAEERLLELADDGDANRDGISGRAHRVVSAVTGNPAIGRFGWKATQPTVLEQVAAAFVNDIGITSPIFPAETLTPAQSALAAEQQEPEIDAKKLDRVAFYSRAIAVPAPRNQADAQVARGKALFSEFGCAACHVPSHVTADAAFHPAFARVAIDPYTDMLLHDMGDGLADGKREGDATPSEWRTPPLWGIGLIETVNGHQRFLHDGRARGFAEAVLWHGGEGEAAKERFRLAPLAQREALLAFLRSL